MPDALRIIIAGLVAAFAVPWLLSKLSGSDKINRNGEYYVLEYNTAYKVLMNVSVAFFLALTGLAIRFPGKTDPAALPWAIATFVFFAALSAFTSWLMTRIQVYWNDVEISGADALGRRHSFAWAELIGIDDLWWAQSLRLRTAEKGCIWVSPQMQGFAPFIERLDQEAFRLGIELLDHPRRMQ